MSLSFRNGFPLIFLATAMGTACLPAAAKGAELLLVPSLALKEEINDNIYLAAHNPTSDFITTIVPSIQGRARTERFDGNITTGFNYLDYIRHGALGGVDFFGQSSMEYRATPLLTVSTGGGYVRNSRPDQISQATGLVVNTGSDKYDAQAGATYVLGELTNASLNYGFAREKYDSGLLLPTTTHSASLAFDHNLERILPNTRTGVTLQYSNNDVTTSNVDNYAATLMMSYNPHEFWKVSGSVGGRYTHTSFEAAGQTFRTDDTGAIGNLSLAYADERSDGSLNFTQDLTTASGRSSVTERTSFSLNVGRRLTEELRGDLSTSYSYNRSKQNQFSTVEIDEKTFSARGSLRYTMTRYLDAEGSYQYTHVDYGGPDGGASQNLVMLRLNLNYELGK